MIIKQGTKVIFTDTKVKEIGELRSANSGRVMTPAQKDQILKLMGIIDEAGKIIPPSPRVVHGLR